MTLISAPRRRLIQGVAAAVALPSFAALAQAPARQFRIGNQKGYLTLLKGRGTLEKRLAPLGVSVKWTEFTAGPVQLEALNVGSIDFGDVGEAPPIFAQAAGAPLAYVGATVVRPQSEAVLVPKASAIKTVAELKGKKIALNKGSNVHYFIVKLFEKHGLSYADLNLVYLPPADARAAFEKGSVDAWVIWDPFLAAAEKSLDARILADATGVVGNRAYYFSSLDYVAKNADVLAIAIEELNKIDVWGAANKAELAGELAALWGLPKPVAELSVNRSAYGTTPITKAILAEQQKIADTFFDLKLIPKKINVLEAAGAGIA
ncbi:MULTISPECIES: sulfonate ABC transporter substrate-binding protein [Variovorax]|jgi:sulfonate transport system substrate-binding protein|uniref:sulfonate ABC transporter substrate-binding protein n=1 Tax=Variovorax TaxID=34072 RepID=UPI00086F2D2A|nr:MULTISPECIES: sulfonate ABC transporter substrate-binding protein [Variovorax]MBN8754777.1 sulfonate ABC transporter substrate-binding protein [Variovorax sp.]ODU11828.1 MAG: ABC transporter substrate-binding protein [Variovorax sp. SCN 67-85]ODV14810.1 MAG: ABC transporter substrate-binding protein [Variovorax sp. SCN 67-20]OJZ05475.1 MAG: sulfonate ABC transporter substrate-binding protein [Variovorax sp. 67-131]UKI05078.1 sulfonate ABC transporter substrate-binding protein [Variovorax pa